MGPVSKSLNPINSLYSLGSLAALEMELCSKVDVPWGFGVCRGSLRCFAFCDGAELSCRLPLEKSVGGAALLSSTVALEALHSSETAAVQ